MTFEERLEALTQSLELHAQMQMDAEERADREIAAMRARQSEAEARADREIAAIRAELRRGIRLSIEEQRRERQRRSKSEDRFQTGMDELRASQRVTEEMLKDLIQALRRGKNGDS